MAESEDVFPSVAELRTQRDDENARVHMARATLTPVLAEFCEKMGAFEKPGQYLSKDREQSLLSYLVIVSFTSYRGCRLENRHFFVSCKDHTLRDNDRGGFAEVGWQLLCDDFVPNLVAVMNDVLKGWGPRIDDPFQDDARRDE